MTGEYRVRAAIFARKPGGVYNPAGRRGGDKKHGHPLYPPPLYRPPQEQVWVLPSLGAARDLARNLRLQHGDSVVVHIEPVDKPAAEPRPKQTSLVGEWPRQCGGNTPPLMEFPPGSRYHRGT
jgi:hypothetical protein